MFDEKVFQKIADDVQSEFQMGGLTDGLYYDFAKECAQKYISSHPAYFVLVSYYSDGSGDPEIMITGEAEKVAVFMNNHKFDEVVVRKVMFDGSVETVV
jgi:hypothetical protein